MKSMNSIADNKRNDILEIFYEEPEELDDKTRFEDMDLHWRTRANMADEKKISAWDLFNFCIQQEKCEKARIEIYARAAGRAEALEQEIKSLKELVKSAYEEGCHDAETGFPDWSESRVKKELEK